MKILKFFLFLTVSALIITSCSDNIDTSQENLTLEEHLELAKNSDGGTIEFLSLEELNAFYISKDLSPVTLEDLGVTEEEYKIAQQRVNSEIASTRSCSGSQAVYFLDVDNNGFFNSIDVWWAHQALVGNVPLGPEYTNFGYASLVWPPYKNFTAHFSTLDKVVGEKILLGIYPCF